MPLTVQVMYEFGRFRLHRPEHSFVAIEQGGRQPTARIELPFEYRRDSPAAKDDCCYRF